MNLLHLTDIKSDMFQLVGAKAYQLGLLKQLNVNVPPGFVVTSQAFNQYLNRLKNNDSPLFLKLSSAQLDQAECMEWFKEVPLGDSIMTEIGNNITANKSYAVRSSSSTEDLEDNSFAGQYKTILNVRGVQQIEEAIKECWASFWNERVRSYKKKINMELVNLSHSVIIQEMVIGEVSGVAFSANPLNGRRDEILIDAAWGLCEGIVNGSVRADHIIIDKYKSTVKKYNVHDKERQAIATEQRIVTTAVTDRKKKQKCLDSTAIDSLVNQINVIEKYMKKPVDIEWTINKGNLYILQARPITTLLPLCDMTRDVCNDSVHIYVDFNTVSQGVKEPMTPIGQETQNYYFSESFSLLTGKSCNYPKWLSFVKGRLFLDLTVFMGHKSRWKGLAAKIGVKDPSVGEGLLEVMKRNEKSLRHSDVRFRIPVKMPYRVIKNLYIPMISGFLKSRKDPDQAVVTAREYGDKTFEQIQELFAGADCPQTILEAIRKAQPLMMKFSFIQYSYCAYGFMAIKTAEKIINKYNINCDLERVRRSLPTNPTTIMGHQMISLAIFFSRNPEEKLAPVHPKIREFLKLYGHRGNIEMDIGTPRWHEEPETVIKMIQGYINSPNLENLYQQMDEEDKLADLEIEKIYSQLCDKAGQSKAKKVLKGLNDYRKLAGLREQPKFDLMRINDLLRKQLLRIGDIFVKEKKITKVSDVVFLDEATIRLKETDFKTVVEKNKLIYQQNGQIHRLPPIMTSTGECVYGPANSESDLKGYPVAPGQASGRLRKLMKPDAALLEKGDIILTYSTNPSWTPLFILAGGLIMESGGVMSHGSIVAREYSIPAIVLAGSTQLLEDGRLVKINGNNGEIEIIENNHK